MLKSFRNNRKLVRFSIGVPVYRDFYSMKLEAEYLEPRDLSGFEGIPVYRGVPLYVQRQGFPPNKITFVFRDEFCFIFTQFFCDMLGKRTQ